MIAALVRRVRGRRRDAARELAGLRGVGVWVLAGALATPVVVGLHEASHAAAALALGLGPATVHLSGGTEVRALDPFLAALDAGRGPAAAAAASGLDAWPAIAPTWAAVVLTYAVGLGAVWASRWPARRPSGATRGPVLTALAIGAVGTVALFRAASLAVAMLAAVLGLAAMPHDDEPRMAAVLGHPTLWLLVFSAAGLAAVAATPGLLQRTTPADARWRVGPWASWAGVIYGHIFALQVLRAMPPLTLGV